MCRTTSATQRTGRLSHEPAPHHAAAFLQAYGEFLLRWPADGRTWAALSHSARFAPGVGGGCYVFPDGSSLHRGADGACLLACPPGVVESPVEEGVGLQARIARLLHKLRGRCATDHAAGRGAC